MVLGPESPVCHYTYVDSVGVLGLSKESVLKGRVDATNALDAVGLLTHELTEAVLEDEALGVYVDGGKRIVRIADKCFSRIRGTLQWILDRNRCAGST